MRPGGGLSAASAATAGASDTPAPGTHQTEGQTLLRYADILGLEVKLQSGGTGDPGVSAVARPCHLGAGQFLRDAHAQYIVHVQYRAGQARHIEQLRLGRGVTLHVAVVIQMVARAIGQ